MARRLAVILLLIPLLSLLFSESPAFESKISASMPHTISLRLEPDSVSVDAMVKIVLTFVPCVDVDSLSLRFSLPRQQGAQAKGPLKQEWQGNAKKGQEINLSGLAVFHRAGRYSVHVFYQHPDPEGGTNPRWDTKVFPIVVPGGIDTASTRSRLPIRGEVPRTLIGRMAGSSDTVGTVRPLGGVTPRGSKTPCSGWSSGDTVKMRLPAGRIAAGNGPLVRDSLGPQQDSIGKSPTSLLTPPCGDTIQVIATRDYVFQPQYDGSYWQVEPSWLGTVEELTEPPYAHWVRFRAGSVGGVGRIYFYYGGYWYYYAVMVIADYHLEGNFLYYSRDLGQVLAAKGATVRLFTADPQANDLILGGIPFRFAQSAYTDGDGLYRFDNLNVDSIGVVLYAECASHEVGYLEVPYWIRFAWYYSSFDFECFMHYLAPSVSFGPVTVPDDARGALNILSLTKTGVDYVDSLPDSPFPEKVIMWWDPDSSTSYRPNGIEIAGQVYDLITVSGKSDDPDEWDQDVFLHEYGHFVMDNYAGLPPEVPDCNPHRWAYPSSEECAYTEGWATFYSCACQNEKWYIDTRWDGQPLLEFDVELPTDNPQGRIVEGAVCASLWDLFDYPNDGGDQNGGWWWQGINLVWWASRENAYTCLGHYPFTICEFNKAWACKGYPRDEIWQNIFIAHGIGCAYTGVAEDWNTSPRSPNAFLWPNSPNPFNPQTSVAFRIPSANTVHLRLFNTSGQLVRTLVDSFLDSGTYTVCWNGTSDSGTAAPSGIYFCNLNIGAFNQARKFVLLR